MNADLVAGVYRSDSGRLAGETLAYLRSIAADAASAISAIESGGVPNPSSVRRIAVDAVNAATCAAALAVSAEVVTSLAAVDGGAVAAPSGPVVVGGAAPSQVWGDRDPVWGCDGN